MRHTIHLSLRDFFKTSNESEVTRHDGGQPGWLSKEAWMVSTAGLGLGNKCSWGALHQTQKPMTNEGGWAPVYYPALSPSLLGK